jgi:hypothetical protein
MISNNMPNPYATDSDERKHVPLSIAGFAIGLSRLVPGHLCFEPGFV